MSTTDQFVCSVCGQPGAFSCVPTELGESPENWYHPWCGSSGDCDSLRSGRGVSVAYILLRSLEGRIQSHSHHDAVNVHGHLKRAGARFVVRGTPGTFYLRGKYKL